MFSSSLEPRGEDSDAAFSWDALLSIPECVALRICTTDIAVCGEISGSMAPKCISDTKDGSYDQKEKGLKPTFGFLVEIAWLKLLLQSAE